MATSENGGRAQQQQTQPKFGGLKQLWCPFFLKGKCNRGSDCPLPHVTAEAKTAIQSAIAANKNTNTK
jgi:hypothetical protein